MSGKRVMLTGRERQFLAYWLDRAAQEAPGHTEAAAIELLRRRLNSSASRRSHSVVVRPMGRLAYRRRLDQYQTSR